MDHLKAFEGCHMLILVVQTLVILDRGTVSTD